MAGLYRMAVGWKTLVIHLVWINWFMEKLHIFMAMDLVKLILLG